MSALGLLEQLLEGLWPGDQSGETKKFLAAPCPGTSGVQASKGEWALQIWRDQTSCLLSFELFLFECSYLWLTSSKLMQTFVLPQKCRYCSSAATNQMSSLVYSEQCWKLLLESFFSNPTLKIFPTSRKHILFSLWKSFSLSHLFSCSPIFHILFSMF